MKSVTASLVSIISIVVLAAAPARAAEGPGSLFYPTIQTDILSRDFLRIALLAEGLGELNGRFAYHLYGAGESCMLPFGCNDFVTFRAKRVQNAAFALGAKAREFYADGSIPSDTYAQRLAELRPYFDELAHARYEMFKVLRETPNFVSLGSAEGDRYCVGINEIYQVIMYLIVNYPKALGLGSGHNDD